MKIRIATRKSKLALWQAKWAQARLLESGLESELVLTETIGDKKLDTSIAKIGSKGVFTEELEDQLADGSVHIAVHSAKDLSATLPAGFEIIAFGPREEVSDVLISHKEISIDSDLLIGSSSTRRVAQLAKHFPRFSCTPVRGNLQTRISKLEGGACDALLLAKVGVIRMGLQHLIKHEFDLDKLTPAAGQGSIAIECHDNLDADLKAKIREALNDNDAERAILAERSFLKKLEGGCSIPVFASAKLSGDQILLQGGILSLDGTQFQSFNGEGADPISLGHEVADAILTNGGDAILKEIKNQLQ